MEGERRGGEEQRWRGREKGEIEAASSRMRRKKERVSGYKQEDLPASADEEGVGVVCLLKGQARSLQRSA